MLRQSSLLRIITVVATSSIVIFFLTFGEDGFTQAVVVDGKRKGPSALNNQSHEGEMIDGYNTKTCGMSDPDMKKSEFVNSAREGQFPWLVSFQISKAGGILAHYCMGSFISDKWILTAAHCFADP